MPQSLNDNVLTFDISRGVVRLRTLTTLRWLAIAGQTITVFFVHFGLGFEAPIGACIVAIAASVWVNIFTMLRFSPQRFLNNREASGYIAFDILQLAALLALNGGLLNPFSALIIAPVTIAAGFLPMRYIGLIVLLALASVSLLFFYALPLPWIPGETIQIAPMYKAGVWAALSLSILFFAGYARRISVESGQMRSALSATQAVLDRERRLSALGGLAAAAAHELGTPLATIQVTAKELSRDLKDNEELREDAELLVSQAERCRDILGRLSQQRDQGDAMHNRISIDGLLREAADPFFDSREDIEIRIETTSIDGAPEPNLKRHPELIYGLRNFIENAVGFAATQVGVLASWTQDELIVTVNDDGPGFSSENLARLGEPYAAGRSSNLIRGRNKGGLGLGFFIAKTLLETTGAQIDFTNRVWGDNADEFGASVVCRFPLEPLSAGPLP